MDPVLAVEKVTSVPELLENILVKLPHRDLFTAARVCKNWKTVIAGSSKIQKGLCLKPIHLQTKRWTGKHLKRFGERHEISLDPEPQFSVEEFVTRVYDSGHCLNPLMSILFEEVEHANHVVNPALIYDHVFEIKVGEHGIDLTDSSAADMYLTQPPTNHASFTIQEVSPYQSFGWIDCEICSTKGVTLADLMWEIDRSWEKWDGAGEIGIYALEVTIQWRAVKLSG